MVRSQILDRARLATLDRRETHLAFVKERYQNVHANVLYARLDPRGRGRMQIAPQSLESARRWRTVPSAKGSDRLKTGNSADQNTSQEAAVRGFQ
jgi:hypothetical protein